MKILITGGFGFIGKRFIRKLGGEHQLVIFAIKKDINKIRENHLFKNIVFEQGKIEDKKVIDVISKHKPDVILHLAALTGLQKCYEDPDRAFLVNVYGTHNVITGCIKSNSKLIFISSREVYGETNDIESIEESDLKPNNVYGLTKLIGESLVKIASLSYNLDYTIFRITNVYGPEGDAYGAQIILQNAIKEKKIRILGGDQKLNFIFVDDVVKILEKSLDSNATSKQTFNLGSKNTLSIEEYVIKIKEILDFPIIVERYPMRKTETINFHPSLSKLNKFFGNMHKTSIDDGIKNTIEWYSK